MDTRTISLEDWARYAQKGVEIPITVPLHGSSMEPLIRYMKDEVTIVPLKRAPMVGDIVMFRRADGAHVVHRVYRVTQEEVITWGDNCLGPDAPLKREDVLGLVTAMRRNGKRYPLDTARQRAYGVRWMRRGRKVWLAYRRMRGRAGRAVRRFVSAHKQ